MKCDWKEICLGDITKWSSGGTPSKSNPLYWGGTIPWISAKNMPDGWLDDAEPKITELGLENGSRLAPPNSILMLVRGSGLYNRRYICITRREVAFNQDVKCIETTVECLPEFLYYWLRGNDTNLVSLLETTGIGAGKFDTKRLQQMCIMLPPLEEQQKIVSLFRSFDDKIELNNKINDNLEQQATAIFKSWFVDYMPFDGTAPKEWRNVILDDITSLVTRGIAPKYSDDSDQTIINQKCIRNHMIDLSLARKHTPKAINEKWLHFGDLLINSTGTGTLGRTAQVWFDPQNLTVDSHVTIVRPARENLIFYIGLWGISHEKEIESLHTGSTGQTELPRERVKAMELHLPDNETLDRFNAIIAPMAAAIVSNQEENKRLAVLRDTLLPKLMNGEIDVDGI